MLSLKDEEEDWTGRAWCRPKNIYTHTCILTHTGGATYAESSRLIVDGAISLVGNVAQDSGGAFYLSAKSSFSAKNNIIFDGNAAGAYGGLCYVHVHWFALCPCTLMSLYTGLRYVHVHCL